MGNKNNNSHIQEEPIVVKGICMNFQENLCQDSGLIAVHWVVFRKLTWAKTQETSSLAKINSPYYLAEFLPLAWQDKCPVLCLLTYPSIYFCGVGNITQGLHLPTKISATALRPSPQFILCKCVCMRTCLHISVCAGVLCVCICECVCVCVNFVESINKSPSDEVQDGRTQTLCLWTPKAEKISIFPFLLLSKHFKGFQVTMVLRFMAQFVNTGQVGHM